MANRIGRATVIARAVFPLLLALAAFCVRAELPALIPREALLAVAEQRSPKPSPDGKSIAFIAPDEGRTPQIWVRSAENDDARALTKITDGGIREYQWSRDGRYLFFLQDQSGDEKWRAFAVKVDDGALTPLSGEGEIAGEVRFLPGSPREVLVRVTRDRRSTLLRAGFDPETGKAETKAIPFPPNVRDWVATENLDALICLCTQKDGSQALHIFIPRAARPLSPAATLMRWGLADHSALLGLAEGGKAVYVLSDKDAETLRVLRIDIATGAVRLVAEDPLCDVSNVLMDDEGVYAAHFQRWTPIDPALALDFAELDKIGPDYAISARGRRDNWLVTYTAGDAPEKSYRYDRAARKATLLFSAGARLEKYTLAKSTPISFISRDGIRIHGFLTLPVGIPAKKLPLVLLVHGGPWNRDSGNFSPPAQLLANRGYAVLQVNYRGSTGYGKRFLNAGNRAWGAAMQNDLSDAVAWATAGELADPARIAIMGTSYGGYAALCGLAFTPDLFVAGVSLAGPSDLVALRKYRGDGVTPLGTPDNLAIGNPDTERESLAARSPINSVNKIRVPLFIVQGANDPRVRKSDTDAFVDALRKAGKEPTYLVYPGEGHTIAREADKLSCYAQIETFLAKYLGGRAEPAEFVEITTNLCMEK